MRHRKTFLTFIAIVQFVLFLAHYFLYQTWTFRCVPAHPAALEASLGLLSISFVVASVLAFSYTSGPVRVLYKGAAVWMGFLSFLFLAALLSWVLLGIAELAGMGIDFHRMGEVPFALALALGSYGIWNASWTRITRARIRLQNLPDAWRGRKAALISDVHLGHVRNRGFLQRLISAVLKEEPDLVFIAGDLFGATAIDAAKAPEPLNRLTAPHGVYFVAGNHEQFGDDSRYLQAVAATGIRVLSNEKVEADGLQIIGVPYR